jgi:hypothetical protein
MKKLLLALLAVALLLLGAMLPLVLPRHCPVNRVACERIKEGMTQEEVHAILGGPPGDYRTRPAKDLFFYFADLIDLGYGDTLLCWLGDDGLVTVVFEQDRVVHGRFVKDVDLEPYGLLDLICWRLGRLKERWLP